ncbi:MAG: hypothetical protein PSY14_14225 [bacterium]|nr:hypothetical protein [bacterium]
MDKLDEVLSAYTVRDADRDLLERIVTTAAAQPHASRRHVFTQAVMFAAVAVIGFWLGNATPAATETSTQSNFMDNVILGPDSVAEMQM